MDSNINWDKHLQEETNAYLDSQDIVEDFRGNTISLSDEHIREWQGFYFLNQDADEFLEYLTNVYSAEQLLEWMGAE